MSRPVGMEKLTSGFIGAFIVNGRQISPLCACNKLQAVFRCDNHRNNAKAEETQDRNTQFYA